MNRPGRLAWRRRRAWGLAAVIAAATALMARTAAAHPMGNFSINHYTAIAVVPARVELRYLIDMAEIPTFQEMREHGFAADPADPRLAAYLGEKCRTLKSRLILELGGRRLELRELGHNAIFPPGAGGLPTMKLGMHLVASLAPAHSGTQQLDYRDLNFPGRAGWKEVVAAGEGGVRLASSSVPEHDRSAQLSNYPVDLLNSPPQVLEAHLRPAMIAAASAGIGSAAMGVASLPLRANRIGTPRNAFTELMTVRQPGTWFLLTAALIAIALGALHALEPGHGKTVVAAYLVGSRGTARHAVMLAATVTASHTAGVYVLGALTLYASRWIIPERIYPWLGGVSGMIIAGLGIWLFTRRLAGLVLSPLPNSGTVDKCQLRARLSMPPSGPSPVKFTGEGWGEGAGGPAKIATDPDYPSAPVRLRIWQRPGDPHPNPLPGQGEGIHKVLRQQFNAYIFPLATSFSTVSSSDEEGDGAGTLQAQPPHDHSHDHSHPHDHDRTTAHSHDHHDSHDHAHEHFHPHRHDIFGRHITGGDVPAADGERLSMRGLLALGVTGGIVPCPAALVVLLSALSLNRAGFGLFLIVAFSAGLAGVLVCFGLTVVYARRFVAQRLHLESGFALRWLPLVSSAVITVAGVAITFQALASGGIIGGWR